MVVVEEPVFRLRKARGNTSKARLGTGGHQFSHYVSRVHPGKLHTTTVSNVLIGWFRVECVGARWGHAVGSVGIRSRDWVFSLRFIEGLGVFRS